MSTIRFTHRIDKPDSKGLAAVELVYQVSGARKYYSTGEKLLEVNWDQETQSAIYIDKKSAKKIDPVPPVDLLLLSGEAIEMNSNLDAFKRSIADIEKRFELDSIPYSATMVIDALKQNKSPKTKKETPSNQVYDYIDKYVEENKVTRVKGSLSVYKTLSAHLKKFKSETNAVISFGNIDHTFFKEFQIFLLTDGGYRYKNTKGLTNTTVAKQLSTLKTFLSYAKATGIEVSDKYKLFKIKKEEGAVIALTDAEFHSLFNLDLKKDSPQDHVRNAFCFACTTGLRYSDLKQLTWENIKEDEIVINVIKKKKLIPHNIPLTPYSKSILKKYEGKYKPLQVISNQRMNDHLKGNDDRKLKSICKMAGITDPTKVVRYRGAFTEEKVVPKYELIGVHTGRKTFVTLCLERGMTTEEVMPVSGHENYASFKRYVNITDQRKKKAMSKAWGDISNPV
jgi:integrase